jgi:hypothetical protein
MTNIVIDENRTLRDRELLVHGIWFSGNLAAIAIALLAGRALLGQSPLRADY